MGQSLTLDSDIIDLEMQKAFKRSNGLTMLDFRTGSGKSFDLEKNIARFIHEPNDYSVKQIIVLIPNKNNFLNPDSLADRLMEVAPGCYTLPEAKQVIRKCLYTMPNNIDCIIKGISSGENIDDTKVENICQKVNKLWGAATAKELVQDFHCIRDYAKCKNNDVLKVYAKSLEQAAVKATMDICGKMHEFISRCKKVENDDKASEKDRGKAAKNRESCEELVFSFYETAHFADYKVIVTSVDKFMYSVEPIISSRFLFYDKKFVPERLFVFDESDSAYIRMRDVIIKRVNDGSFPFKEYLKNLVCNYLEVQPSLVVMNAIEMAFGRKKSKYSWESLKKQGKEIFKKYHLQYPYKTDKKSEKNGKMPALLNDGTLYTLGERKGYIHAVKSQAKKQVLLYVGDSPEDALHLVEGEEVVDIAQLFREGNSFIYRFCCFLNKVTKKYQKIMIKNEKEKAKRMRRNRDEGDEDGGRDISFSEDLTTILNMFGIIGEEQTFYKGLCLSLNNRPSRPDLLDADNSFYIKGYDIKIIKDNKVNQAENSKIYSYLANVTPESILLALAQKTNVICLSATALNRSVNENFDISFLRTKLSDFYTVSEETKEQLRAFYARKEEPYASGACQIDVIALPENGETVSGDDNDEWFKAEEALPGFRHPEILKYLLESVRNTITEMQRAGTPDFMCKYYRCRYLNLIHGFYEFLKTPSLKSMVTLEMASLKKDKNDFRLDLVQGIVKAICWDLDYTRPVPLITAVANDFTNKKNEAISYWERGEKAIFFSTYPTTSKGSNLQYKIPDNVEVCNHLVTLLPELNQDSRFYGKYDFKDVDCLYLGNYTHLVQEIEGEEIKIRTECFHKVLFELQKLAYGGQISFWDKQAIVRDRYRRVIGERRPYDLYRNQLKNTEGIRNTVNKIIKQSVGRIDRVNQKNSLTKIFIATENLKQMDLNELADTELDLIPAMKKIFEAAKLVQNGGAETNGKSEPDNKALLMGAKKHNDSVAYFNRALSLIYQSDKIIERDLAIQEYNRIRNLVLRYPILSKEVFDSLPDESQMVVKRYYIDSHRDDIDSYVFTINPKEEGKDLDHCHIEMKGFNSAERGRRVAEENTVLSMALKVDGVSFAFKQKGYCTKWEVGRYILTPKGIDLYNGMLGEEVEKIILKGIIQDVEELDGKLYLPSIEELAPDVFERFDFRYGDIYIDAKNWRYGVQNSDALAFRRHVLDKKAECDAFYHQNGTAVILNLLPLDGVEHTPYSETGYYEIPALIDADGHCNERARVILLRLFRKANYDAGKNK